MITDLRGTENHGIKAQTETYLSAKHKLATFENFTLRATCVCLLAFTVASKLKHATSISAEFFMV